MSDIAISLRGLTKAYRLYKNSSDKALGIFNIRLGRFGAYSEHLAIDHMDLDIRRGERVGIIGRNGSGKSTLLKLISRTTTPTSGMLDVRGDIHVLMNLGTGFHPEFTGRENAYAYLAQIGIRGSQAAALVEELATFAEIGQYFDQPLATYSSGMQVRLMFAAATVVSPDILLLDEVLGVGDAYFIHKSFARLRALCTREGTTLLLVTHSPHMAAEICNRLVWIDGGRIMMDGEPMGVINAYEASIRDQEERRLRQMNERLASQLPPTREYVSLPRANIEQISAERGNRATETEDVSPVKSSDVMTEGIGVYLGVKERTHSRPDTAISADVAAGGDDGAGAGFYSAQFQTVADHVPRGQLYIARIRLLSGAREVAALDFDAPERTVAARLVDDQSKTDWGVIVRHEGRGARQYKRYGSVFHKPSFLVESAPLASTVGGLTAEVCYWTDTLERLSFSLFNLSGETRSAGEIELTELKQWHIAQAPLSKSPAARPDNRARYGTRQIEIVDFEIYDGDGIETALFEVGASMRLRFRYRVNDPDLDERPTFIVGFHKDGLHSTHRWWTQEFSISAKRKAEGHIEVVASPLLLGPGMYSVTIAAFREGYIVKPGFKEYFAASDSLYDMHVRGSIIEVTTRDARNPLYHDFQFQHPSRWICDGKEAVSLFLGDHVTPDDRIYLKQ